MNLPICEVCETPVREGEQKPGFPRPMHGVCHGIAVAHLVSKLNQWRESPEGAAFCEARGIRWKEETGMV